MTAGSLWFFTGANVLHISSYVFGVGSSHQKRGVLASGRRQDGYYAPPRDANAQSPGAVDPSADFDLAALMTTPADDKLAGAGNVAQRYSTRTTTTTIRRRTTPHRVSLEEECDYLAYYCLKAYKTGRLCGRTLYYNYQNFKNYCMLDYVNCMERYEVWQVVHMGDCFNVTVLEDYQHYEYHDDSFLDQIYVIQE